MADMEENEYGEPIAPQGAPPGSAAPGTPMETGPDAGAGGGRPEDVTPTPGATERGSSGPLGSQDGGGGDLGD